MSNYEPAFRLQVNSVGDLKGVPTQHDILACFDDAVAKCRAVIKSLGEPSRGDAFQDQAIDAREAVGNVMCHLSQLWNERYTRQVSEREYQHHGGYRNIKGRVATTREGLSLGALALRDRLAGARLMVQDAYSALNRHFCQDAAQHLIGVYPSSQSGVLLQAFEAARESLLDARVHLSGEASDPPRASVQLSQ